MELEAFLGGTLLRAHPLGHELIPLALCLKTGRPQVAGELNGVGHLLCEGLHEQQLRVIGVFGLVNLQHLLFQCRRPNVLVA